MLVVASGFPRIWVDAHCQQGHGALFFAPTFHRLQQTFGKSATSSKDVAIAFCGTELVGAGVAAVAVLSFSRCYIAEPVQTPSGNVQVAISVSWLTVAGRSWSRKRISAGRSRTRQDIRQVRDESVSLGVALGVGARVWRGHQTRMDFVSARASTIRRWLERWE